MKLTWENVGIVLSAIICLAGLGWLMAHCLKRTYDPARLVFKWVISAVVLGAVFAFTWAVRGGPGALAAPIAALVAAVILTILWAPHLGALLAKPITSLYDGGDEEPEPEPLYSIALAKRKRGKPQESVLDIREQLERFPTDVTGQLLLAEIMVQDLNDLQGAQLAIERLVAQPGHTPTEIAAALTQLADWHLKYGQDTESARAALARIDEMFPNTPMSRHAAERIAHLSGNEQRIRASAAPQTIPLRPGVQNIGLMDNSAALVQAEPDPTQLAEEYVSQLEQHPLDSEAREKLALIYADHYQRLDLAVDQLEQLIQQPNQPPRHVTRWLNLLADLHIKRAHDLEAAKSALNRIVELFPGTAPAENAKQRLAYLKLELRGHENATAVKMGTYEENLGLKKAIRDAQRDKAEAAKPAEAPTVQPLPGKKVKLKL